ncbi:unnamed protein product [Rotaria sp. Silwood1]|nr:unnamed protein product [Rotaria sp. Silwood1]CAF3844482.1 unnamed protein product [Rotaria sp. Silwood1]CAF4904110.1 unnamed protein product [Rotaria sp. Silwood1]
MKAALALIFFACVAGSMASDARSQFVDQLVQEGQVIAQTVLTHLQQQILGYVQQAFGQLTSLVASIGRFDLASTFAPIVDQFKPLLTGFVNQALVSILGSLQGLIGRNSFDFGAIFQGLLDQVLPAIQGIGQHVLNQGLAAVLGSLGNLGGSRGFNDIIAALQQQISNAVTIAQSAITGAVNNIASLGSSIVDASKPHWEQLQEQLVGHGLNALGSISETINNLHGSINGGR